jgi:hypothetical protein
MAPRPEAISAAGCFWRNQAAEGRDPAIQGPERAVTYFLCGGVKNGDGVADAVFLSFLGFLISRLLFF